MKKKINNGVFFGVVFATTSIIQSVWRVDDLNSNYILKSIVGALVFGILGGLLFNWVTKKTSSEET